MEEIITRLSNVQFRNVRDPKIVAIFERYFSKSVISMGALSRKIPFLLLELAQFTNYHWCASGEYFEDTKKFKVIFNGRIWDNTDRISDSIESVIIINRPLTRSGISNVFNIINTLFAKDKWIPFSVVSSTVRLKKAQGKFLYTKKRYRSKNMLFYFEVRPEPFTFIEHFLSLFKSKNTNEILGYEIVSYSNNWEKSVA